MFWSLRLVDSVQSRRQQTACNHGRVERVNSGTCSIFCNKKGRQWHSQLPTVLRDEAFTPNHASLKYEIIMRCNDTHDYSEYNYYR